MEETRTNKQFWNMTEWLYSRRLEPGDWILLPRNVKDYYYDVTALFLRGVVENQFK